MASTSPPTKAIPRPTSGRSLTRASRASVRGDGPAVRAPEAAGSVVDAGSTCCRRAASRERRCRQLAARKRRCRQLRAQAHCRRRRLRRIADAEWRARPECRVGCGCGFRGGTGSGGGTRCGTGSGGATRSGTCGGTSGRAQRTRTTHAAGVSPVVGPLSRPAPRVRRSLRRIFVEDSLPDHRRGTRGDEARKCTNTGEQAGPHQAFDQGTLLHRWDSTR